MQTDETSGPEFPDENQSRDRKGGTVLPADNSGWRIGIECPALSSPGSARNSFTFIYGTSNYNTICTVRPLKNGDKLVVAPVKPGVDRLIDITHMNFLRDDSQQLEMMIVKGSPMDDGKSHPQTAHGWSFEYVAKGCSPVELQARAFTRSGASYWPATSTLGYVGKDPKSGFRQKVFVQVLKGEKIAPKDEIDRVEIQRREGQAVDFDHVVVRPDLLGK
jgi:hypothetical protein